MYQGFSEEQYKGLPRWVMDINPNSVKIESETPESVLEIMVIRIGENVTYTSRNYKGLFFIPRSGEAEFVKFVE